MKTVFLSVAAMAMVLVMSCTKEDSWPNSQSNGISKINVPRDGKAQMQMLHFASDTIFLSTMDSLEVSQENTIDSFERAHLHLSDEDYNNLVDSLNFDSEGEYANFERIHGFGSLRNRYNSLLDQWLRNDSLVPSTHPANSFPFSEAFMTLLNVDGVVKIDNRFLWFSDKGYAIVGNNDHVLLNKLLSGDMRALSDPNILESTIDIGKNSCSWVDSYVATHHYHGNNKVVMTISHFGFPWFARQRAQMRAYRRIWGSFWVPRRRNMKIGVQSDFETEHCAPLSQGLKPMNSERRRHSRSRSITFWGYGNFVQVRENSNACGLYGFGGITRTYCL